MSRRNGAGGSRYLYEPFGDAGARVDTLEQVQDARWAALERRLDLIERLLDRMERRLWVAVYSVASVLLIEGLLAAYLNSTT
ncbi:MAG: GTA head formation protein, RCAP_rcc01685 family [Rubricella sp.]